MNKPKPKAEIATKINQTRTAIKVTCIGSDACVFVKELTYYGSLIDASHNEEHYKIYLLYVLNNYDIDDVNNYILSYNS